MMKLLNGKRPPRCIVFMDEVDKAFAGSQSDTSGVSQDYLGTILQFMQDKKEVSGMIFVGPPGAAKSAVAKAAGNTANIPTIAFDLNGMKGSLVGESEARLRAGLKVVDAISQGSMLFIATCNSMANLPSALRRRFTYGTYFFDLPTREERDVIWSIYYKKYGLPKKLYEKKFDDSGWTGSEIKQACAIADKLQITTEEAAKYIVPVSVSASEEVDKLRVEASGRFISASYPGCYMIPEEELDEKGKIKRRYRM
jgi:SpoVK/Ycf46/Vps4 family AAA+-type ATPase